MTFAQMKDTINLYFAIDEYVLSEKNQQIVDSFLNKNHVKDVNIIAYTDFLGTAVYNQILSEKRCQRIKNYLLQQHFPEDKLVYCHGKGIHSNSSFQHRTDSTDQGIPEHRKVEIIYTSTNDIVSINKEIVSVAVINEEELEIGNQIVIENIIFHGGTPIFKEESEPALRQLADIMKKYADLKIEIQGHICCQMNGEDGYDITNHTNTLSVNRAKAVYDFLIRSGINKHRMTYKGFGSAHKRFPDEKTPEEENLNRRVEIMILEK